LSLLADANAFSVARREFVFRPLRKSSRHTVIFSICAGDVSHIGVGIKKILIVEDDPYVRLGIHACLKANHYDVICAAGGMASIAEARKDVPDLIILDLDLPAGDGFSVMERLNANDNLSLIPMIVLSARDLKLKLDRALNAGAKAFLQKPVDIAQLLSVIRKALGEKDHTPAVVHHLGDV
jgi:DNA-binding response OmpR family regulator